MYPPQPVCTPKPGNNRFYRLVQPYGIYGVEIPAGFEWDGASLPRFVWTVFGYTPFMPCLMLPSLVHDYLYSQKRGTRRAADELFLRLMKENGVDDDDAESMFIAVRNHGHTRWMDDEDKAALTSPPVDRDEYEFPV